MYRGIVLLLFARLAAGQDAPSVTVAPALPQTSGVSISKDLDYALQRSCVKHCIYYNGPYPRGPYYHDWDDVGGELGCGYAPINGCYCNTKYASSATSYFNSCIPYYCGSGEDADPNDLVSALSLYNDYCATANGNPTKPVPVPVTIAASTTPESPDATPSETSAPGTTSAPASDPTQEATTGSSSASAGGATAEQKTSPSPTEAASQGGNGGGGLSKGTTIGIAVGVSVGVIVLIAAAVLIFLSRRKSALAHGKEPMGGIEG